MIVVESAAFPCWNGSQVGREKWQLISKSMNNLRQCKLHYYFTVNEEWVDMVGAFRYIGAVPPSIVVERRLMDGKNKYGFIARPMTHVVLTAGRQFADRLVRSKSHLPHRRGSRPLPCQPRSLAKARPGIFAGRRATEAFLRNSERNPSNKSSRNWTGLPDSGRRPSLETDRLKEVVLRTVSLPRNTTIEKN